MDPHHHLWDRPGNRYTVEDLIADIGDLDVTHTVFVECMASYRSEGPEHLRPVGETEFVMAQARESECLGGPEIAAIIGFADLRLEEQLEEVLDAHELAGEGRFRGIRHAAGWDEHDDIPNSHTKPPRHLYLDPRFHDGARRLARRGWVLEAWQYHSQIDELRELATAVPEVTIVLDHLGGPLGVGPYSRNAVFPVWRESIAALADCSNVVVKLGGLAMPRNGFGWHERDSAPSAEELAEATAPYYRHCLELFGAERCMFESNFPVDKVSAPYPAFWRSFDLLTSEWSLAERSALFFDTAARTYRFEG